RESGRAGERESGRAGERESGRAGERESGRAGERENTMDQIAEKFLKREKRFCFKVDLTVI
ncbi:MAG: hypothetical protein MI807_00570, partial [Verrucomicrobiales bacterium]|nr:hypothetical protein [Verrucomicrobiales bacterium]